MAASGHHQPNRATRAAARLRRSFRHAGLVHLDLKINLRCIAQPYCWATDHSWQPVIAGDAFSRSFAYCRRCGFLWRTNGRRRCWTESQHRWEVLAVGNTGANCRCERCGKWEWLPGAYEVKLGETLA